MELEQMMNQCREDGERWFPSKTQTPENLTLCVAGEVGEIANILKKVVRGSMTMADAIAGTGLKEPIQFEIIDALIYLCNLMGLQEFNGIDWNELWRLKRQFNENRFGGPPPRPVARLPYQVLAEAGLVPEKRQNWQQEGDFAS